MQHRRSVRLCFRNEGPRKLASSTTHNSITYIHHSHSPYAEATVNARTGARIH
jgi:hypothetical protein